MTILEWVIRLLVWIRDIVPLSPPYFFKVPVAAIVLLSLYLALYFLVEGGCYLYSYHSGKSVKSLEETLKGFLRGFIVLPLFLLAAVAAGNYLDDFGKWRYGGFFNAYEFYHYYMGSKYSDEIGYSNLYAASYIADYELTDGKPVFQGSKRGGKLRDLRNGSYISTQEVLNEKDAIKARFSEARWREWLKDIQFFKKKLVASRWEGVLCDKGYNGTPIWSSLVGGILSNHISTDNETGMNFLATLDLLLILATTVCVAWAFGPRAAFLMLIVLGTAYMSKFSHMKGAYLRTDFAMTLVLAACMLKKNRYAFAGFFTAWAVCARVFPAVFLFGMGAKLFWELLRIAGAVWDRAKARLGGMGAFILVLALCLAGMLAGMVAAWIGLDKVQAKFGVEELSWVKLALLLGPLGAAGAVLAVAGLWGLITGLLERRYLYYFVSFAATALVLFSVSVMYSGGLDLWKEYSTKISHHNQDISPWRVGLKYAYIARFDKPFNAGRFANDAAQLVKKAVYPENGKLNPVQLQKDAKALYGQLKLHTYSVFYAKSPQLWWTIQLFMLVFALFAARGLRDSMAFAFGFVPCYFLASPTYYYYIMIVIPLLFFSAELERPSRILGLFWILIVGMMGYFFYGMWVQEASTYQWCSFLVFVLALYMMLLAAFERRWWFHGAMLAAMGAVVVAYLAHWYVAYLAAGFPRIADAEPFMPGHIALVLGCFVLSLTLLECVAYFVRPAVSSPPVQLDAAEEPVAIVEENREEGEKPEE